jgi:hypothetical protein
MYNQLHLDSVEAGDEVVGILKLYTAIAEYALCSGSGLTDTVNNRRDNIRICQGPVAKRRVSS